MYYFGDAAAAVLVSKVRPGKLRVETSFYESAATLDHTAKIGVDGFLRMNLGSMREWIGTKTGEMLKRAVDSARLAPGSYKFVGTQFSLEDLEKLASKSAISASDHWHNVDESGFSFGSSAMCVIGDNWDKIKAEDTIVVAQASAGPGFGFVVLKA
jgi:3-oxoacyl-[acyl-carrier-protein] synthase III